VIVLRRIKLLIILFIFSVSCLGQEALNVSKVSITVSDLEVSKKFYQDILTFKLLSEKEYSSSELNQLFGLSGNNRIKVATLKLGEEEIELIDFLDKEGRAIPKDSKSNDLWFQHIAIVVNDMGAAYKILWDNEVQHVSTSPQTLPDFIPAAAGISAFYFQDPDGHNLEIIYFPQGKDNPKWQNKSGGPFIGIDHTAIGISSTKASRLFYGDIGLKVSGDSHNYGSEQEHLNQVFGANLMITGNVAQNGIGVEFLDYIAPPGGRTYPADSKVYDLWHWHTTIQVAGIESILKSNPELQTISTGIVSTKNTYPMSTKSIMVRDTDGHAILLIE